jgi:hypothetical protein
MIPTVTQFIIGNRRTQRLRIRWCKNQRVSSTTTKPREAATKYVISNLSITLNTSNHVEFARGGGAARGGRGASSGGGYDAPPMPYSYGYGSGAPGRYTL